MARISSNGGTLKKTTYIGTSSYDQNYLVDVDVDDMVYCYGQSAGNMPVSSGVFNNAGSKQFIQRFNKELTTLDKATVFGNGSSATELVPTALMVSDCKEVYISGWGGSFNDYMMQGTNGFEVTSDAIQSQTDGSDFYIMVLGEDLEQLNYASFIGGLQGSEHVDGGTSRFDRKGTVYQSVCADCGGGSAFPVTAGAYSEENNSSCNLAVIKMDASTLTANIQFDQDSVYCSNNVVNFTNLSTGGKEFKWVYPDESVVSSRDGQFEFLDTGSFTVQLVAIDPAICPFSDTTEVIVQIAEGVGIDLQLGNYDCSSGTLSLTVDGPISSDYKWSNTDGPLPGNTNDISITTDTNTIFYVEYEAGCGTVTDKLVIPLLTAPVGGTQDGGGCYGDSTRLPFKTFDINTYSTLNGEPFTLFNDSVAFVTLMDGPIYLETSGLCGNAIDTFNIDAIIIDAITSPDTLVCSGERVPLTVTTTANINWESNEFSDPSLSQQVVYPNQNESIIVELTDQGCSAKDTVNITVFPRVDQPMEPAYTIDWGETVSLSLSPEYTYSWSPTDYLSCINCNEVTVDPQEDVTYRVQYTDTNGCFVTDSVDINVIFPLFIPNAFTPTFNFENDVFKAESHAIDEFVMFIYNRWGEKVFESHDINQGWDGTLNGIPQQMDVYVYKIEYTKVHLDKHFEKVGTVTLLR